MVELKKYSKEVQELVYGILTKEAERWKLETDAYEKLGLDLVSFFDQAETKSAVNIVELLGNVIDVDDDHIMDVIADSADQGITDGKAIYERIEEEVDALMEGKAIISDSKGRRIVGER